MKPHYYLKPRRLLFWTHLCVGVAAGTVIFIMAATGVVLAYEKQIIAFSIRGYRAVHGTSQQPLPIGDLLTMISSATGKSPSGLTLRAGSDAPVELSFGRERVLYVNPYTGNVIGESRKLPAFFSTVENIHRWLGANEGARSWGKAVTGSCTLAFVVLTLTGPFIWWPREWTRANLKKIILFRRGLSGRALYWNWHNVLGIWCAVPLFVMALTGVIMSYSWANNLLYRITGNEPPAANAGASAQPPDAPRSQPARGASKRDATDSSASPSKFGYLESLVTRAQQQVPQWRTIQIRLPNSRGPISAFVDQGSGGRPDQRSQFSFNSQTGEIREEAFSSYNSGRKLRTWARFTHTGEAGGALGQTIAALACASAAVLVLTGLVLSLKRLPAATRS